MDAPPKPVEPPVPSDGPTHSRVSSNGEGRAGPRLRRPTPGTTGGPEGERHTSPAEHQNGYQHESEALLATRHGPGHESPPQRLRVQACSLDAIAEETFPIQGFN